jgi:hypothetical protein
MVVLDEYQPLHMGVSPTYREFGEGIGVIQPNSISGLKQLDRLMALMIKCMPG